MSLKCPYTTVFIDDFQPITIKHIQAIITAGKQNNHITFLVTNSFRPRTSKDPFTYEERFDMIVSTMDHINELNFNPLTRFFSIVPVQDCVYDKQSFITNIQAAVDKIDNFYKIELLMFHPEYLRMFPQWKGIASETLSWKDISSIKTDLYTGKNLTNILPYRISQTIKRLQEEQKEVFDALVSEYNFITEYKAAWKFAPYTPTFVTADTVVIQSGHILMVERGANPGKGLLALPGGFVNPTEFIEDAALRELEEETKIDCPEKVLRGNIKDSKIFDYPLRSLRGRTITQAFYIELPDIGKLPKVKGSDDATSATWIPLSTLNPKQIFEDHFDIIQYFVNC